jgi:hypothetical protein
MTVTMNKNLSLAVAIPLCNPYPHTLVPDCGGRQRLHDVLHWQAQGPNVLAGRAREVKNRECELNGKPA